MRTLAFVLVALFLNPSFGQDYDMTVFGTDLVSSKDILRQFSNDLDELKTLYDTDRDQYRIKKAELGKRLQSLDDFAYSNVTIFRSYTGNYSCIIDFVETKEASSRLNFRTLDVRTFDDPDSLLTKWQAYEELSFELFNQGEITDTSCPVIHCVWSFNHPKLAPYLEQFTEYAPKNSDQLIDILSSSESVSQRASAAFLLAHAELSGEALLQALMPGVRDPESSVRNNSMRVIYYLARAYPNTPFNLTEIIEALNFPSFTDRNKALVILRSVPLDSLNKEDSKRLAEILIEILQKKDAHNYRNAHTVIKKLSQENFGVDDIESWKSWAASMNE